MQKLGKNLTDLSYNDSSLIFYRNLTTGRNKGQIPAQVRSPKLPSSETHIWLFTFHEPAAGWLCSHAIP